MQITNPLCLVHKFQIEIQRRKNQPIPEGWAQDKEGNVVTDADIAYKSGCLMPLGGAEINSGYKGSGLGLLVKSSVAF